MAYKVTILMAGPVMRTTLVFISACLSFLITTAVARAQSVVTLSPTQGHPSLSVKVSGTSFGANEAIDVYIDTVDTVLLVSSATGAFSGSIIIPAAAVPGVHTITAIGRHSGDAAQKPLTVTTAWAEYGFGAAHYGWNPYENTLTQSTVPQIGLIWSATPSAGGGGTPAIVGPRMFIGTANKGVESLSSTTGKLLWSKIPTETFYASPAVVGNAVYIGSLSGNMYAFNTTTGAIIWSQSLGGAFYGSPVVVGGILYVGGYNGVLYALQASTGTLVWSYNGAGRGFDGSPTVVNGVVYIGCMDGKIYAVNATTGVFIWSYMTGAAVESTPAIVNNVLYIGSDDDNIYALDSNSGSTLWTYATGGSVFSNPAVASGSVYIGSQDGNMYALNSHTGALLWKVTGQGAVRSASIAAGVVYFTSANGSLYAVNAATGGVLASGQSGSTYFGAPAISDGVLYVSTSDNRTHAFAPNAGTDAVAAAQLRVPKPSTLHPNMSLVMSR